MLDHRYVTMNERTRVMIYRMVISRVFLAHKVQKVTVVSMVLLVALVNVSFS
jgi:hypothetical protein